MDGLCVIWRGNIRELQNAIESAIIVSRKNRLHFEFVSDTVKSDYRQTNPSNFGQADDLPYTESERLERDRINIGIALKMIDGRISGLSHYISGPEGAARLLDIKPTTLASRIETLAIRYPD